MVPGGTGNEGGRFVKHGADNTHTHTLSQGRNLSHGIKSLIVLGLLGGKSAAPPSDVLPLPMRSKP